ncbi:MAG TPA: hypothetical protein VKP88_02185 [Candidatus Paceibacterota bacterium]|nr:hypothetical protein [Candidatus Paceibacterota bacterium]
MAPLDDTLGTFGGAGATPAAGAGKNTTVLRGPADKDDSQSGGNGNNNNFRGG